MSSKSRCLLQILVVLAICFAGACPLTAQVELLTRNSFLNATDFAGGGSDIQEFTELGSFSGTSTTGEITVSQTSTVTESLFAIEAFADGGSDEMFNVEAFSLFRVDFDLSAASTYLLEGVLEEFEPNDLADSGTTVTLLDRNLSGNSSRLIQISSDPTSIVGFNTSGLLQPGEYTFEVDSRSFGFGSVVSSDLSFTFSSVPEPCSGVMVTGVCIAMATRRRRVTRK